MIEEFTTSQQILKYLISKGYRQKTIAKLAGLSQPTVSRLYLGIAGTGRLESFQKLRAFVLSLDTKPAGAVAGASIGESEMAKPKAKKKTARKPKG